MLTIKTSGIEEFLDPSGGAWVKVLVMGAPGSGKTRSASFYPQPIFADCERGLMSVADRAVPYATITCSEDMDALLEHLRKDGLQSPEKRKYRTLVIDTVDSYQRILIQERLKKERKENLSGWADWGFLDAKMSQLIEKMLNLQMNIVVNMHVKDERDEDGDNSILVKKARLKGDIKDSIFQDFDLIGQMESSYASEDGERVLNRQIRWAAEPRFPMLRDRSGKLPRFTDIDFTEGDYDRIFNAFTSGVDDLPESADVESIATESDGDPAAADVSGGPVTSPTLPRPKPAAKTAAKKAVAKKTAPATAPPEVATGVEEPADKAKPVTETTEMAKAEKLLEDKLGASEIDETTGEVTAKDPAADPWAPPDDIGWKEPEEKPAKKAVAEPVEKPGPKKTVCGDQKPGMEIHPAYPGCGKELTAENAMKVQIASLKTKTQICDDCFADWKKTN